MLYLKIYLLTKISEKLKFILYNLYIYLMDIQKFRLSEWDSPFLISATPEIL